MDWKLTIAGTTKTLADWGVENVKCRFTSLDADALQFQLTGAAADAATLCAYGASIVLLRDTVPVFAGTRVLVPSEAASGGENQFYTFLGPWEWLAANVFKVVWRGGYNGALTNRHTSHIIQTGSVGGNIQDVINYAIARGAPMQLGVVDIPTIPPYSEFVDKTCAAVIHDTLQYAPDAVAWFDYTTTPPTFHCRQRSHLTPVSIKLPTAADQTGITIEPLRIVARPDLQVPSVEITCEITSQVDGQERFSFYVENWPLGTTGLENRCLSSTINLQGFSATHVTGYIEGATIDSANLEWWKQHDEKLRDPRITDISLVGGSVSRTAIDGSTALDFPRELVDGEAAVWMVNPDNTNVEWGDEFVRAKFNFTFKDAGGDDIFIFKEESFSVRLRTTNAPHGATNYSTLETFEAGDPVPVGLARYLYESLSPLHFDVQAGLIEDEVTGGVLPRHLLNITNGDAAWATMNAVVQEVSWSIDDGTTQITAGPPRHLSISDLLTLLRANRTRRRWTNPNTRSTGELSGPSNVALPRAGANTNSVAGHGVASLYVVKSAGGSTSIRLDATGRQMQISDGVSTMLAAINAISLAQTGNTGSVSIALADTSGHALSIRAVPVCVAGINKQMMVLGSAPF